MNSLADLLDANSDRTAIEHPGSSQPITLGQFSQTAYRTGNYLRHLGVGPGATVGVADDFAPDPLYVLFGAGLLGASVQFGPPADDWQVFVGPTEDVTDRPTRPGSKRIAYGDRPTDPAVAHFGTDVWSENPAFPDDRDVGRDEPLLETVDGVRSHGDVLDAARAVVDRGDVTGDDEVVVRAPLSNPGTVPAGVVAPLLAEATVLLPGPETVGTVAVADGDAPESRVVDPGEVR